MRLDSQDVGLEAAITQGVRNSSLVECSGADNVTRLSIPPKLWIPSALQDGMVGERSLGREA